MADSTTTATKKNKESKIDIKEILMKYLVYSPFIIICLALSLFIVYVQLRYTVPTYSSSINVLIKDIKKTSSLSEQVLGDLSPSKTRVDMVNQMEILKSATLMQRVVEALQLNLFLNKVGNIKTTEAYKDNTVQLLFDSIFNPEKSFNFTINFKNGREFYLGETQNGKIYHSGHLFSNQTGKFRIMINYPELVNTEFKYSFKYVNPYSMASRLSNSINVSPLKGSNIVYISTTTEDPKKGRDILNQLVKEYNASNIEDQNRIVDNSIQFIDERLQFLTSELGSVEEKLADFSKRNEVVDMTTRSEFEFTQANTFQQTIQNLTLQMQLIDMIKEYLDKPDKKYQLVPSNLGISDVTLNSMISQYNSTLLSRDELLKTVPESNPSVVVISSQAEKLRGNILEALNNLTKSYQATLRFNQNQYNQAVSKLSSIPDKQLALKEISRQQGIKEQLYLFLLQKREESAITKASTIGGSQPIDPAVSSGNPVSPNEGSMYRMAFIIGLGLPIGLIYLKHYLNNKIITRQQVANATDCPLLGEISHDSEKERRFVVSSSSRSLLAEQYRILRTNVQFLVGDNKNPVLMVTSSVAGEGKTYNSMNLAAVFAVSGKRTVMVEMDLRKPKISSSLNMGNVKGITHYLMGEATADDIVTPLNEISGLFIVPAGIIPPNPAELILDTKIRQLIEYLRSNFDFVIIDMAPIGLVSDAKIIGQYVDATVYIIRQRYTLLKQLNMINEMYENKVMPNMGIITNDVKMRGNNSYYGYYGYGYGYGYGTGYTYNYNYGGNDEKKGFTGFLSGVFKRNRKSS